MVTATNSREPPKISMLINRGYQKENPDTFIYIPYAIPRHQKPEKIGIVCGKAALRAFRGLFSPAFIEKLISFIT